MSTVPERSLEAWIEGQRVGRLREANGLWAFAYDQAWRDAPEAFDLAPSLPRSSGEIVDGASQRPVQWFFDNLLPEDAARELLARDAGIAAADSFGLLQRYGPESAGSLTLLAPGTALDAGGLRALPDAELSQRIRNLPRVPLMRGAPKRMSMAGAQHKLAVVWHEGALFEPVGRTASTHLLKPDHQDLDAYPHSVANEWFTMRLAAAVGLEVPEARMHRVPEPVYLVRRFDRIGEGAGARRLHALDGCQVLSLAPAYKYDQADADNLARLAQACRQKARARQALFRWAVFNLLTGNGDAHLKNLSFLVSAGGLELAPHYDLVATSAWREPDWAAAQLTTPIGQASTFASVRRSDVLVLGELLGLPPRLGARLLDELLARVEPAARNLSSGYEASAEARAGEARLLRQIVHGPVVQMTRQLRA